MTNTFRITPPRALQDLENIGRYTLKQWGREQRNNYLQALERRFKWLADNHHMGAHRPEIQEGYFSYVQGPHLIFYLKREGGIDIIGLLINAWTLVDTFLDRISLQFSAFLERREAVEG